MCPRKYGCGPSGSSHAGGLPRRNQPPAEHKQFPNCEKRSKNRLVAASQPERQVDVEVTRALHRVASGQIRQGTTAAVDGENCALDQNQPRENSRQKKLTPGAGDGNRHDAPGKEQPNHRVQKLYSGQDGKSFGLGSHDKSRV